MTPEAADRTSDAVYNPVFERLVRSESDLEGIIAYGVYKFAKREWSKDVQGRTGAPPLSDDLAAYHLAWTPKALQALRENAAETLTTYADVAVAAERPTIERDALARGRPVWKDVLIAIASAFTYSVLLLATGLIIQRFGIDLATALRGG